MERENDRMREGERGTSLEKKIGGKSALGRPKEKRYMHNEILFWSRLFLLILGNSIAPKIRVCFFC